MQEQFMVVAENDDCRKKSDLANSMNLVRTEAKMHFE